MTQRVGVQAVFDVSDFERNLNRYISALSNAESSTRQSATRMASTFNTLSNSISNSVRAMNAQLSTLGSTARSAASAAGGAIRSASPSPRAARGPRVIDPALQAGALQATGKEQADLIRRLAQARDKAIADIAAASAKAAGTALKPAEFRSIRDTIRKEILGIQNDLSQTVNRMRGIGAGLRIATPLNAQIIDLRTTVRSAVGDINSSLSTLRATTEQTQSTLGRFISGAASRFLTFAVIAEGIRIATAALRGFINVAREGFESVAFFDRLRFAISTNLAQELRKSTDFVLDMDSALQQVEKSTAGFIIKVEQLAVKSPFTVQDVAAAVNVANAYGFTTDQILRLTSALIDLGAARGLRPDQLESVSRAIGQIIAKGKLYQQEINQLGEAGIPIVEILKEEIGLTDEAIAKAQAANEQIAGSTEAIEALLNFTEKNFAGAAERASLTLGGLLSTLSDIKQISLRSIFEGLLTPIIPQLQEFVKFASSPEFRASLQVFGEALGQLVVGAMQAFGQAIQFLASVWDLIPPRFQEGIILSQVLRVAIIAVVGTIGLLISAIVALNTPLFAIAGAIGAVTALYVNNFDLIAQATLDAANFIGEVLGTLATTAVEWGTNIVNSLADGIIGAVDLIISAIEVIGEAIAYLLVPGSPPRLLPDLDKWGTEAAEVYLEGWTEADFGILDKIANQFKSFFNALAQQGKIEKVNIPSMVIGAKQAVAQAIAEIRTFGEVSGETLSHIANIGGEFGEILTGYVTRYANLAIATDAATAAQERLNEITKKYDAILKPLQRQLSVIQDKRQTAEETKKIRQLQNVINSRYVSEARRTQAQLELDEILLQQKIRGTTLEKDGLVDVAQAELDAANETKDRIDEEFKLFEARVNQQLDINQLLGEQKSLMDALVKDGLKKAKEEMDKQIKAIQIQRDEMRDLIRLAEINYRLEKGGVTEAERKLLLLEKQSIELERQKRAKEAEELGVDLTELGNVPIVPEDFLSKSELKGLDNDLEGLKTKLQGIKDLDLAAEFDKFQESVNKTRERFGELGEKIDETFTKFSQAFGLDGGQNPADAIANAFVDGFIDAFDVRLREKQAEFVQKMKDALGLSSVDKDNKFTSEVGALIGTAIIRGVFSVFGLTSTFDAYVAPAIANWTKSSNLDPNNASSAFRKTIGSQIGLGITKGILDGMIGKSLSDLIFEYIVKWRTEAEISSPSKLFQREVGEPIGQGILEGISKAISGGIEFIRGSVIALKNGILGFFGLGSDTESQTNPVQEQSDTTISILTNLKEKSVEQVTSLRTLIEESFTLLNVNLVGETGIITLMAAAIIQAVADVNLRVVEITLSQNATIVALYNFLNTDLVGEEGAITKTKTSFIQMFQDMSDEAIRIIKEFIEKLMELLTGDEGLLFRLQTEFVDKGKDLGEDFAEGIAEGITDNINKVEAAAVKVANKAIEAAQAALNTGSPSRKAAEMIGEPYTLGIVEGMISQMSTLTDAANSIATNLFGFADVVEQRLGLTSSGSSIVNTSNRTNVFNLSVNSQQSAGNVVRDFSTMRAYAGS